MKNKRCLQSDIRYLKALVEAGVDGISSAKKELGGRILTRPLQAAAWPPMAIGATACALGTRLAGNRKASSIAVGGLIGSLAGLAAGLAWNSRRFAGCAARVVSQRVSATREERWLATHPIDYA